MLYIYIYIYIYMPENLYPQLPTAPSMSQESFNIEMVRKYCQDIVNLKEKFTEKQWNILKSNYLFCPACLILPQLPLFSLCWAKYKTDVIPVIKYCHFITKLVYYHGPSHSTVIKPARLSCCTKLGPGPIWF